LDSLPLDDFDDGRDLFGRDPPPFPFRPTRHDLEFEVLMQPNGAIIVAQRIGKKGKRQLSRSASAIAPAKAGRGMVEQVQPQRQWLGFLAVTDSDEGLPRYGIAVGCADVGFAGHVLLHCKRCRTAPSSAACLMTALYATVSNQALRRFDCGEQAVPFSD